MIEWHIKTPEELERFLETDLENGLSEEKALLRCAEKKNILFAKRQKDKMHYAKQMMIVLLPLLVLVTAVAALMIGEKTEGYMLLFSSAFCVLFLFGAYSRARFLMESAEEASESSCRVLRSGVYTIIPHEAIVTGDVLYLQKGDFVPADCRLIRSSGLVVRENGITSQGLCKKDAAISPCGDIYDAANMVWAGTVVEEGVGLCVVCLVGDETHFGSTLEVAKDEGFEETELFKRLKKISSIMTASLFGLLFFSAVLGFFSLTSGDFFEGWMLISAFSASAMADFYGVFAYIAAGHALYGLQSGKKKLREGILLKRGDKIETLASINRLFVTPAWFVSSFSTKIAYLSEPFGRGEAPSQTIAPYAQYILRDAALSLGEVPGGTDLARQESEEERIRRVALRETLLPNKEVVELTTAYSLLSVGKTEKGISYGVILREKRFVITLFATTDLLVPHCRYAYRDGKLMEIDTQRRERIFTTEQHLLADCENGVRECYAVGVTFLDQIPDSGKITDDLIEEKLADRLAIEGFVVLETPLHQQSVTALENAMEAGLGVVVFGESEKDRRIAAKLGFSEKKPAPLAEGECCAVFSATLAEKLALLRYSKKIGERAAYAGEGLDELLHMKEAAVAAKLGAWQLSEERILPDKGSKKERDRAKRIEEYGCDATRYSADLLISHPETLRKQDGSLTGQGGFYSICEGIRHAGSYVYNMRAVFAYLAFSTAVKLVPALLSLFLPDPLISPGKLALIGLVFDPLVVLSLALSPPRLAAGGYSYHADRFMNPMVRTALAGFVGGMLVAAFSFLLPAEKDVTLDFVTTALFLLSLTAFPLQSALLKQPYSHVGIGTVLGGIAVFLFLLFEREEFHLMATLYLVLLWVLFLAIELAALTLKKEDL